MTTLTNSFEGGTDETAIMPANSGGGSGDAFDDVLNAVYDTARAAHGSVSCRWSLSGSASAQVSWLTAGTTWFARAYVYLTSSPPANLQLITPMDGATIRLMVRIMTNRTVQITSSGFGDLGQSTTVLPLGQWVRIEAQIIEGTGAGLCTVRIFTTDPDGTTPDETIVATSTTISSYERIRYGANFSGSQTYSMWGDDLGASDEDWLGAATLDADLDATDSAELTGDVTALDAVTAATDTAAVTESAVLGTSNVRYSIAVDWDGDGDFTTTGDDVTARTLERGSFTAEYGRDQARSLSPSASGRASLEIDNRSRDYSPDNQDSPLTGKVLPARPLRIQATQQGVIHTLFRGHTDDYEIKPARNERSVAVTGLDAVAMLKGTKATTQLHKGVRTGEAIGYVLDAIDWPAERRDLDLGATYIRWWWVEDEDAFDAIQKLVASEGPPALLTGDEQGRIVFRDRHHRLLSSASVSPQATLTDTTEPAFSDFTYDHGWRDVVNAVTIKVDEYDPARFTETVWESADVRSITASGSLVIRITLDDPVLDPAVTFDTLAGSVAGAITQESGQTLTLTLTAGATAAAVNNVVVTGRPVTVQRTYQIQAEDASSIGRYGRRDYTHEAAWPGVHDAAAIADLIIGARAERQPIVTVVLKSQTRRTTSRLTQQLARDLSDRVHVREPETAVDHDFFIDRIKQTAKQAGLALETEFGMERAATQPEGVFRFDDDDHGFDDGVFGSVGLDDPETLFIFDADGHGFDDGVFAT